MHPDFNPKFSHLKPPLCFFHTVTKDAQPAEMQAARGKRREGAGENDGGGLFEEKMGVLIQGLNSVLEEREGGGEGGVKGRWKSTNCLAFGIVIG